MPDTLWRLPKIFWGLSEDTLYNIGRDSARYDLETVKDPLETARHSGDCQKHSGDCQRLSEEWKLPETLEKARYSLKTATEFL